MNQKIKRTLRNTFTSLGISALLFCLMGVAFDFAYKGSFHLENYRFSRFVLSLSVWASDFRLSSTIMTACRLSCVRSSTWEPDVPLCYLLPWPPAGFR